MKKFLAAGGRGGWIGLDVGCGGHIGILAEYGLDASPVKRFVIKDYPREKLTTADVTRIPFPDNSFDYVVSAHLIEHLPKPINAVNEMARVAKYVVIANVPRYTRDKEIANRDPCVSLDIYYFSHFPERMTEFGLSRDDFKIFPTGATVFDGYEAPHCGWYPYPKNVVELFETAYPFRNVNSIPCPGNCGETNTFGWL